MYVCYCALFSFCNLKTATIGVNWPNKLLWVSAQEKQEWQVWEWSLSTDVPLKIWDDYLSDERPCLAVITPLTDFTSSVYSHTIKPSRSSSMAGIRYHYFNCPPPSLAPDSGGWDSYIIICIKIWAIDYTNLYFQGFCHISGRSQKSSSQCWLTLKA